MAELSRLPAGYRALADRAGSVRRKLERSGIDVTTIVIPTGTAKPAAAPSAASAQPAPRPGTGAAKPGISFATQIAPVLVKSCGGCHVAGQRGNFQMASYEGLMRSGMVQRGAGNSSRLVEVILTGDMPRGGGKVSAADVATLVKWIDAGATCDSDPTVGLDAGARSGAAAAAAPPDPGPAAKPVPLRAGDVSFATEVAPLLIAQCLDCHGERNPEANLRMATLDGLMRGGRSGPVVVPGRGADSQVVKKLRGIGIEGQRMPLNRDPLSDAEVAMLVKWIDQGAKLDLLTGKEPLETVAAAGRARSLSNAELAAIRTAAGGKLWRRAIPDEEPVVCGREGVCLIGSLAQPRLEALAGEAAEVEARVRKELAVGDGPLIRGGVVLYPFERSFDYSAVWQTLVGMERPKGISGHAATNGDVVYGALLLPSADADEAGDAIRLLLAEQIAAAAFSGRGAPDWFCRGAGRAVAPRVAPRAPAVKEWRRDLGAAVRQVGTAQDFLAARADPAVATLVAGGFLGAIGTPARLAQMVKALDGGETFEDAFVRVFKAEPRQAYETWAARQARSP